MNNNLFAMNYQGLSKLMVDDYFEQTENIKIDVYGDLENGFINKNSKKNDDSPSSILEYMSFQKLWESWDSWDSWDSWGSWDIFNFENNIQKIKEKRFYINKNNCQIKCFDIPCNSDKYITEDEIQEILYNNIDSDIWCGPYVIGPELYLNNELLIQYLCKCVKRKKVRFEV